MENENIKVAEEKVTADEKENTEIFLINGETIEHKIYTVRGQKVMLDVDLAEIYGYETKNFNRQVKNNRTKFEGDDFMFQLTKGEWENLRCKNFTSSWGGSRYLPLAFTEQGIYMLMTVLHGDLATKQSRALIRTFKQMKDYIIENQDLIGEPHIKRGYLVLNGNPFKADIVYDEIYRQAKQSIFIVDNYIGLKTLEKLINIKSGVDVSIYSDNLVKGLRQNTYVDFCNEYPDLKIQLFNSGGIFHDRYIILDYGTDDEKIFLCGASSKDAGGRITSILEDPDRKKYDSMIKQLLKNKQLILK